MVAALLSVAIGVAAVPLLANPVAVAPAQGAEQELWLVVQLNHTAPTEPTVLLRLADGRLLARAEDLQRWRLRIAPDAGITTAGERYVALDSLPGLTWSLDEASQVLVIDAVPGLFTPTVFDERNRQRAAPTASPPGAFFNYDVSATMSGGRRQSGALLEAGLFNRRGVGVADFLVRDYGSGSRLLRLGTSWTYDNPDAMASLRVGDAITSSASWGRSVRFGGVQWATNFATQPGFIPFPLPQFAGEATLPSTVDLLVDNVRRMSERVPPGPFRITDLPLVSGAGEAHIVVRDLLGREQRVALPYYVSPSLLQAGLDEFSYEAGFVRDNFGLASNDYGRFVASATRRHGFSDRFTAEAHVELLRDQQTAGAAATWLVSSLGTVNAALAASRSRLLGDGGLLELGFQHQSARLSFGVDIALATPHFIELGLPPGAAAPSQVVRAYAGLSTREHGSFGLSWSAQRYRDREPMGVVNAGYNVSLGSLGYLSLSVAHLSGAGGSLFYSLSLTRPLSEETSASASLSHSGGRSEALVNVQRNLPVGDGYGYRVQAGAGNDRYGAAALTLQNGVGTYMIEGENRRGESGFRAEAAGSIVRFGDDWFASRRIDDSFGVVQVAGFDGVRVYAENQEVGRTNAQGNLLVPHLRPYEANAIRIEQADLPLDAQVDALGLAAVPALRSGVLIAFPVRSARAGLLTIVLDDGKPIPAGAVARVAGGTDAPVGQDGAAYLTGLAPSNPVHVTWRDHACELLVLYAPTGDPVAQLGSHVCHGVPR